jgi:signal transduction histidine kinase
VNLVPIVLGCVGRVRARGRQFRLNTGVPQGLTASVDPERFEQVLDALLHHATTRCRGGCWIDVDLRRPLTGQARLEVRDFGRSVSDDDRQQLLAGGHGDPDLDLARAIVELHGGRLQFEFPADGGVRAVVTLPTQHGRVLV